MRQYKLAMLKRQSLDDKTKKYYPEVYKPLFAIDYCQNIENPVSTFQLDRSFTIIDWKYAELIETRLDFTDLESQDQLRLIFSVFPGGNSLLQMLAAMSPKESIDEFGKQMEAERDCE